ncbi:TPA: hypothetical protein ACQZKM_001988 [Klebsiella pneumoniae]
MDSESGCLPLDYLQGHKDGLEWAAQLAEANHPETGDWLYDDPIELAKAIRKGPDMPPAQSVDSEPVAWTWQHREQWHVTNDEERARDLTWDGVKVEPLYRHAQPAPVSYSDFEEFWSAYIHPLAQDDELKDFSWGIWNACVSNSQPAPVVPDGYVMVPKEPTEAMMLHNSGCQHHAWDDPDCAMRQTRRLIWSHMLAAAPQEVNHG